MSVTDSDECGSSSNSNISIVQVCASEMYPKKRLIETDDDSASIKTPFILLCGEEVEYLGRTSDGILAISNYRLYNYRSPDGKSDYNIPLGLIEMIEIKEMFHLCIYCKDARTFKCSFPTNDLCIEWSRRLFRAMSTPKSTEELFAFVYYAYATDANEEKVPTYLIESHRGDNYITKDIFQSEIERMKFDVVNGSWRVSSVNVEYKLCSSYPKYLIVPARIIDKTLEGAANFRSTKRIPAVVWRHKDNGMIIARCSQPEVGLLWWRSPEDEELLKAIPESCCKGSSPKVTHSPKKLLIIDARSYTTAIANRARGGGCEYAEYYPNCEILFMNLANIHSIRKSFHSLRQLCASSAEEVHWHSLLEATRWLQHMSLLIQAAVRVVTALEKDAQSVLVHCSDGWDRTSQIVSLAELLLDPYYRTVEGFQVLVEREWLDFGHKFSDRCGIGEEMNEKCPVFLQWLDCVHNILSQFPCAFEFSKRYLIKLAEHTYSNLFGTFLCNTNKERLHLGISNRTFSVWKYLSSPHFRNYLYNPNFEKVLWPKYNIRDLELWRDLYIDLSCDNPINDLVLSINNNESVPEILNNENHNNGKVINSNEIENGNLHHSGHNLGSMLESAINCRPEDLSDSHSPKSNGFDKISVSERYPIESIELSTLDNNSPLTKSLNKSNDVSNGVDNGNGIVKDDHQNGSLYSDKICEEIIEDITNIRLVDSKGGDSNGECPIAQSNDEVSKKNDSSMKATTADADNSISNDYVSNGEHVLADLPTELRSTVPINKSVLLPKTCYKTYDNTLFSTAAGRMFNSHGSLLVDPIDGLPFIPDDIQDRMQQICIEHKARMVALEEELQTTRVHLLKALCNQCTQVTANKASSAGADDGQTLTPDKSSAVDDDKGSEDSVEPSWEAVEKRDAQLTLWMPDHAVTQCMNCDNKFWLGRRKHHCRSCGKIFCADCSRNLVPLPNEQLYEPVRVCEPCYRRTSSSILYSGMCAKQTCKQAAGEEPQNSNPVLPPTPPI